MGDHDGLQGMFSGRELHEEEVFRVKPFRLGTEQKHTSASDRASSLQCSLQVLLGDSGLPKHWNKSSPMAR